MPPLVWLDRLTTSGGISLSFPSRPPQHHSRRRKTNVIPASERESRGQRDGVDSRLLGSDGWLVMARPARLSAISPYPIGRFFLYHYPMNTCMKYLASPQTRDKKTRREIGIVFAYFAKLGAILALQLDITLETNTP